MRDARRPSEDALTSQTLAILKARAFVFFFCFVSFPVCFLGDVPPFATFYMLPLATMARLKQLSSCANQDAGFQRNPVDFRLLPPEYADPIRTPVAPAYALLCGSAPRSLHASRTQQRVRSQ